MTLLQIQQMLLSRQAMLVGAGVVFLLVWGLKYLPWIRQHVQTPWQKRALTFSLAFLPVLGFALTKSPDVGSAVMSAVLIFLGATATHHIADPASPGEEPTSPAVPASPGPRGNGVYRDNPPDPPPSDPSSEPRGGGDSGSLQ